MAVSLCPVCDVVARHSSNTGTRILEALVQGTFRDPLIWQWQGTDKSVMLLLIFLGTVCGAWDGRAFAGLEAVLGSQSCSEG